MPWKTPRPAKTAMRQPPDRQPTAITATLLFVSIGRAVDLTLAEGDILEPEKTTVEIVQTNDDPINDLPFDIDFGNLPPLD